VRWWNLGALLLIVAYLGVRICCHRSEAGPRGAATVVTLYLMYYVLMQSCLG
jgi:hypothetical protein